MTPLSSEIFAEIDQPPVRNWSYFVSNILYAFGRWRHGRVILARRIATASRRAQNNWHCWQLHNELFGRRQSRGLSAITKLLVQPYMGLTLVDETTWRLHLLSPLCQYSSPISLSQCPFLLLRLHTHTVINVRYLKQTDSSNHMLYLLLVFTRTWLRYFRVFAIANPSVVCNQRPCQAAVGGKTGN